MPERDSGPAAAESGTARTAPSVMAFDVGAKRIGIAIGQSLTGDGRGLSVIANQSHAHALAAIQPLISQWRPAALLVGRPLTLDGGEQPASERARGFARALARHFGLPVIEVDERSSSRIAAARFAEGRRAGLRRRSQGADLDADAAAVLVERYYDQPQAHEAVPITAATTAAAGTDR
ncbi:MAG: Holliday junction resolvase RuvX [Xanthomonadales bacterium]|nr:Holliday junction resolvase RuvX [Xanthomonadales bacterium]